MGSLVQPRVAVGMVCRGGGRQVVGRVDVDMVDETTARVGMMGKVG